MMQEEFEKFIGKTVSPEDYLNIELVYNYYPINMSIQELAYLYVIGDMVLIYDMLLRSKKIQEAKAAIKAAENKSQQLREHLKRLREHLKSLCKS